MVNMNIAKISSCIKCHHVHNRDYKFGEKFSCVLEANACIENAAAVKDNKEKILKFFRSNQIQSSLNLLFGFDTEMISIGNITR